MPAFVAKQHKWFTCKKTPGQPNLTFAPPGEKGTRFIVWEVRFKWHQRQRHCHPPLERLAKDTASFPNAQKPPQLCYSPCGDRMAICLEWVRRRSQTPHLCPAQALWAHQRRCPAQDWWKPHRQRWMTTLDKQTGREHKQHKINSFKMDVYV